MTAGEALGRLKEAAVRTGRLDFSLHARRRMRERGVSKVEVLAAILGAGSCMYGADDGHWVLFGRTRAGRPLRVAFDVEPVCVVITVVKDLP
jgi:hypothetical protein